MKKYKVILGNFDIGEVCAFLYNRCWRRNEDLRIQFNEVQITMKHRPKLHKDGGERIDGELWQEKYGAPLGQRPQSSAPTAKKEERK